MEDSGKKRSSIDDIIEIYKRNVDRTLLRENLKLTPTERLQKLMRRQSCVAELRRAGYEVRKRRKLLKLK